MAVYRDRRHAGRVLASALAKYSHRDDVAVLGLPRGGIPVAFEVAKTLGAPLDVFVVAKARCAGISGARNGCDRERRCRGT